MRIWLEGNAEAMHNPKLNNMLQKGRQQVEEMSVGMLKQIKIDMNLLQDYRFRVTGDFKWNLEK